MSRDEEVHQKKSQATQPVTAPRAVERIAPQTQKFLGDDRPVSGPAGNHGLGQVDRTGAVAGELLDPCRPANAAITIKQRMGRSRPQKFLLSPVAAVVAVIIIATRWIPFDLHPARSSLQRSNVALREIVFVPAKPSPSHRALRVHTARRGSVMAKAPSSAFRRVQVAANEVDYIAEDVTIRHFTHKPVPSRVQRGYNEVHIGADVTIRYFPSKPAVVARMRPMSTTGQSVDRSSPVAK